MVFFGYGYDFLDAIFGDEGVLSIKFLETT